MNAQQKQDLETITEVRNRLESLGHQINRLGGLVKLLVESYDANEAWAMQAAQALRTKGDRAVLPFGLLSEATPFKWRWDCSSDALSESVRSLANDMVEKAITKTEEAGELANGLAERMKAA